MTINNSKSDGRRRTPTCAAIAKAQLPLLLQSPHFGELFDGDDAHAACWACGHPEPKPQRAHIIAHASGGTCEPTNFFLLCELCHFDQPDGLGREAQVFWLLHHESDLMMSAKIAVEVGRLLEDFARQKGLEALLPVFIEQWCTREQVGDWFRRAAQSRASARRSNILSSVRFSVIDAFAEFAARRA